MDLAKIKIRTITRAKCPTQIVEYARRVAVNEQYRHIWCVFDKDEYEDFDTAIQLAQKAGIGVAYSNQAFEIWFILHYVRTSKKINRKDYAKILTDLLGYSYIKGADNIYLELNDKVTQAIYKM